MRGPGGSRLGVPGLLAGRPFGTRDQLACPGPVRGVHRVPDPLPVGPLGDLVRTDPVTANLGGATATTLVLHHSRSATGAGEAVTGTVLVPSAPFTGPGPRPWVAYASGSQGLGEQSAPSRRLVAGTEPEAFAVSALLARGGGAEVVP